MDPRHPNIAFAANTVALVAGVFTLFSWLLPILTPSGWSWPETISAVLVPISLGVSWWARLEHDTPVVHAHGTSADQYAAMEDLPTMVSLDQPQDFVNPNTAAVIASIVGEQQESSEAAVLSAIDTLSSGEIGASSAQAVSHNNVDHAAVNVEPEVKVERVEKREFVTEGIASIPLPTIPPLDLPEIPEMVELPPMPDLDDLIEEDEYSAALPPLDLPDLPEF